MTIALWCLLVAGLLPALTAGIAKWGPGIDNNHPRDWAMTLEGHRRRAYAAHQNSFEAFPFFAAALFAAHHGSAPQALIDPLAIAYIAARVGYTGAYIADRPTLRSLLWVGAMALAIAIFTAPLWGR